MSDIFLSYASEDVTRASLLAHALMRHGWSVWWDRSILPGKVFDTVIEAELTAAKCVIVLWSAPSVESRWVRAEAGEALDKGRLIPVLLDNVVIPLVFRQVQAASLIGWDGDDAHSGFQNLLKAITALVAPQPVPTAQHTASTPAHNVADSSDAQAPTGARDSAGGTQSHQQHVGWWAFAALCALLIAAGTVYVLRDDKATDVAAGRESPPTSAGAQTSAATEAEHKEIAKPVASTPPPTPVEPKPPQRETPVVKPPAPVVVKPAIERPAPQPAPQIVATAEPVPAPAAPLTVLTVTWAMPSDDGAASAGRVKEYSTSLSQMMTTVVKDALRRPVTFDYYYPTQQEYYRLLKDKDGNASSKALCSSRRPDLVISGFVKGAEFVSANYGYALTRNPVFSVFDCKANQKITQTYQVAENANDRFPFEMATTTVFRKFVTQDAALASR